ncbi:protein-export membrane protein SecF [Vibrio sp. 10N.286.49.B3]|uniref:protein translocase subunit SecF n=1 Tax=Vibrio sp. 10N.286.49.B3 TaxID=1880855 RepID=UPI000C8185D9|nr:protein translocase subunit SecF [Vibrio sp. 10N.286.49.B3]PMH46153.1 protein-export membrane protein SecF [Vibrio sp. 10N.286.49.B3]
MTISNKILTRIRIAMSAFSVLLFALSVLFIGAKGFNWGLDFTGGVVAEVALDSDITASDISEHLDQAFHQDVQVVKSNEDDRWVLRYNQTEDVTESIQNIMSKISDKVEVLNSSVVGPQVGQDMVEQGGLAILVCFILIMLYLSVRFEWRLALGALAALIYDVVVVLGLFALLQLEFNLTVLAAVLAVLGYSLNDSIIIADRVRELLRSNPNGKTEVLINNAIRATLSRTLVTSGTTLVTVGSLWLLGGASLQGFAIALFVGIVSGTWSSISVGVTLPQFVNLTPAHYQPKPVDASEGV